MEGREFASMRKRLKKTQKQMAELLGCSVKAVHSYEQGWRPIPAYVERQVFFLVCRGMEDNLKPCWDVKRCTAQVKEHCPAWEFQAGGLCWFVNGTMCEGQVQKGWKEKMAICRSCEVLAALL